MCKEKFAADIIEAHAADCSGYQGSTGSTEEKETENLTLHKYVTSV